MKFWGRVALSSFCAIDWGAYAGVAVPVLWINVVVEICLFIKMFYVL